MMTVRRPISATMSMPIHLVMYFAGPMGLLGQTLPAPHAEQVLPPPAGVSVMEKGPIHESFAETILFDPAAGAIVPKAPPAPVPEVPAAERPNDPTALWISGYWAWEEDRQDFVWVSGVWRIPPPGRTWVSGTWSQVQGGYQWFSGFWGDGQTHVTRSIPPESLEAGPSSPSPGDHYAWVPGHWEWIGNSNTYGWHPGCWRPEEENFVWVPSYYCRRPGGVVFVSAYRDFEFVDRGCLYAPIYFEEPIYLQPTYSYRPCFPMNIQLVASCLFIYPTTCHYYYGDYYSHVCQRRGYVPCHRFSTNYRGFDPFLGYGDFRSGLLRRQLFSQIEQSFQGFLGNPNIRPVGRLPIDPSLDVLAKNASGVSKQSNFVMDLDQFRKQLTRGSSRNVVSRNVRMNVNSPNELEAIIPRGTLPKKIQNEFSPQVKRRLAQDVGVQVPRPSRRAIPADNMGDAPDNPWSSFPTNTFSLPNPGGRSIGREPSIKKSNPMLPPQISIPKVNVTFPKVNTSFPRVNSGFPKVNTGDFGGHLGGTLGPPSMGTQGPRNGGKNGGLGGARRGRR